MPAHCSAGGKAMLAALSPHEVEQRYEDGLPPWPSAKVTSLSALQRELEGTRKRGYGINVEETEPGVSGVAAAVLTPAGRPIAAPSRSRSPAPASRSSATKSWAE